VSVELTGRRALIAGASRGIGLAVASALQLEGCRLAIVARGVEGLSAAKNFLGGTVFSMAVDVRIPADVSRLVCDLSAEWDGLDVLICNVGDGSSVAPGQETASEWQRMLELNLFSATNLIEGMTPLLRRSSGDRSIVCVSSICGLAALGAPVTYSAAKAAMNSMVRGLARPLGEYGIRINAVAPGNVLVDGGVWQRRLATDRDAVEQMLKREVPLGRFGTPSEIAQAVAFLASARASFITGTVMVADGGQLRA
jgi:3-oxoacyl-[acyl-carrier protein] reductase